MSAYGAIQAPNRADSSPLLSTIWRVQQRASPDTNDDPQPEPFLTVHHLTLPTARLQPGLIEVLWHAFADEVERGLTYPQETIQGELYSQDTFESYFFAADVFVAIAGSPKSRSLLPGTPDGGVAEVALGLEEAKNGRSWDECVAGFYYVKPNYPGRSSHICNAGFVVPTSQRGRGYGTVLANSYLFYGPKLGYQASVFNLVYVNNTASVKMWERLNFTKAGLIPRAGRLRTKDGKGEELVDAWVFYKSFVDAN